MLNKTVQICVKSAGHGVESQWIFTGTVSTHVMSTQCPKSFWQIADPFPTVFRHRVNFGLFENYLDSALKKVQFDGTITVHCLIKD